MTDSPAVKAYRILVVLLAGYWVSWLFWGASWEYFAGPYRFLTNWALTATLVASGLMLGRSFGYVARRHDRLVGLTAVLNGMVVMLYWRLYLADPLLISPDTDHSITLQGWYLHLVGPALQWIDALFIHRSFRKPLETATMTAMALLSYIAWMEWFISPRVNFPAGKVSTGFPYPFLNDLTLDGRLTFYATNLIMALILLGIFFGAAWVIRSLLEPEET